MTQDKDQMRAEIEAQIKAAGGIVHKDGNIFFKDHQAFIAAARASAPQGVPEGFALVPVEPTAEMLNASRWSGSGDVSINEEWARKQVWLRMLAAAPHPAAQKGQA